jgi:Tol biopolymer transport system component
VYDWTPDGRFALWQAGNVPTFDLYYGEVAKSGTDAVRLTNGNNRPNLFGLRYYRTARFSPDGQGIAIAGSTVFFTSVPGSKSLLAGKSIAAFTNSVGLSWSPDGRALAVLEHPKESGPGLDPGSELIITDLASKRVSKIAEHVGSADWSRR